MKTWFTSDTHFSHANIIKYCNRPFQDIYEMDRTMVQRWNEVVGPEDTVYHLGDFAMGGRHTGFKFLPRLNGTKHLILGNHDRSVSTMLEMGWGTVQKELFLDLDGYRLFLRHHPLHESETMPSCDYMLCGHVHDSWSKKDKMINVGVDVRKFYPITLQEALK
jgi:calcineurin-like phosphoesterase family protein